MSAADVVVFLTLENLNTVKIAIYIINIKSITMRTKEEILLNVFKQNYTERIFKFQKLVNHDLTLKAMQEYAEECHKAELLKLNKSDVMWRCLSDEYPEPYRCIKIEIDGEIIETRTYLHYKNLMIKFRDGNQFFQGMSPKLLNQSTKWCYNAT